jgi:hypothetical protein
MMAIYRYYARKQERNNLVQYLENYLCRRRKETKKGKA